MHCPIPLPLWLTQLIVLRYREARTNNARGRNPTDAMHGHSALRDLRDVCFDDGHRASVKERHHQRVGDHCGDNQEPR